MQIGAGCPAGAQMIDEASQRVAASSVHDHGGTTDVFCGVFHGATPGGWQERLAHDMLGDAKERSPQGPREAT